MLSTGQKVNISAKIGYFNWLFPSFLRLYYLYIYFKYLFMRPFLNLAAPIL